MNVMQPYPSYQDSGVEWLGDVPEHWEVRRLGATTQRIIAGTWGSDPTGRDDIVCVRVADFDRKRLSVDLRKPTLRSVPVGERQGRLLEAGDLLLEKSGGGDLQPVGAVVHFDHDEEAVASNFIGRMRIRRQNSARYVLYLHTVLYAIRLTVRSIKQTTGIQNLDVRAYFSESIPLPPLSEQAAIARFLDDADCRIRRYIRAKERLIELLEEERRATIHEAVTGRIDVRTGQPYPAYKDSGIEWLGEVPEHWEVRRNVWLFRERSETGLGSLPVLEVSIREGVRIRDMENGQRKQQILDRSQYKRARRGDIAYNTMRMWQGAVGVVPEDGLVSPAYVVANPVGCTESRYYGYLFRTGAYRHATKLLSRGIVSDRDRLYWDDFKRLASPVPPPSEQTTIVRYLDATERRSSAHRSMVARQIDLLREYRTRLIADVVTGKLDVREAAAKPPETDPLAADRDRTDGISTEPNPHSTERDMMKEAIT